MTAKTIPAVGEYGIPGVPAVLKSMCATVGLTSDYDINLADTTQADSDGAWHAFELPANSYVYNVGFQTIVAFSGGSVQIGDSADSDGYFTDTLLDPGTTTPGAKRSSDVAAAYRSGRIYTDTDDNWVGIDLAGTTLSAGNGVITVEYFDNYVTT